MADEFLNLSAAAKFLGTSLSVFRRRAERHGIPSVSVMGRPMYRKADIDACIGKLWIAQRAKPQVTPAQWARSVQLTNALISRLLQGSR